MKDELPAMAPAYDVSVPEWVNADVRGWPRCWRTGCKLAVDHEGIGVCDWHLEEMRSW